MKRALITIFLIILAVSIVRRTDMTFLPPGLGKYFTKENNTIDLPGDELKKTIISEESVVTSVVEKTLPSVVTIGISTTTSGRDTFELDPFDPFGGFRRVPGERRNIEANIGSGFIITEDGLIITNKHVVSETDAKYQVLTNDKKKYDVQQIYRDPLNDLAILKITATGLRAVKLADSSKIKLGQMAIAIGTPLGEFTNTVTTGIVSGLGRGITAGSPFEGSVEKLDNVIQTDAAISPGNSGGPLLNSSGEVMGVNTAVSTEGQNIGFAIPANIIKELIDGFNKRGGSFERPYIGVQYKMVDQKTAVLNEIVEGAYVQTVVEDSPADKAGILEEDIIIEFDGQKVKGDDEQSLARKILDKKIGDSVSVKIWRDGDTKTVNLVLESFK